MTNSTRDDNDRTTSGRFVRNLALSLSGGALVTLLGATAAHAQDSSTAGTDSSGVGQAGTGDATAVGNQSGTNTTQTVTVSGNLGTIQVINQQANVTNTGAAVANTGGNIAIGNASGNTASTTQGGTGGTGPATNNGAATNGSNGSATITTGNASAIGNNSSTTINQDAHGDAHGQLGGILVINQSANVTNSGVALANSGGNAAIGNDSGNSALLDQTGDVAGGIAANNGKATNTSDGKATIATGGASAIGNKSDTNVMQSATGSAGGELGGLVIINQTSNVLNTGAAVANSGLNGAAGNLSGNDASIPDQTIGNGPASPVDVGVASNNGEASNWSNGTAGITTGPASAVGNDSTTHVTQRASSDVSGQGGLSLINQSSNVVNAGFAVANSGLNGAVGNRSDNDDDPGASLTQTAPSAGSSAVGVIGDFGLASNQSDGTGWVNSGAASAAGNRSGTDVSQAATTNGGDFNLYTQTDNVANIGIGLANSGLNAGVGNRSDNNASVDQTASMPAGDVGVGVIGQFGKADNSSDGHASVTTGAASAVGNQSKTSIGQEIDPTGLVIPVQNAAVVNSGVAVANSGGNLAVGNDSENNATIPGKGGQTADIGTGDTGTTDIDAGTLVASNNGEASNSSDGTADIVTGSASATGNESDTSISQDSTGTVDGIGLILNTQTALVGNVGLGVANSGGNVALGNISDNSATATQNAEVGSDNGANTTDITAGILTASNSGTASNASDGTADITTGDAKATGNRSATRINQTEGGTVSGLGAIINPQTALVLNAGVGVANSGLNAAVGNASTNDAHLSQDVEVGSHNGAATTITAGSITAANSGTASNSSDGTANITTGEADGTGNSSSTDITQDPESTVSGLGLVLNPQTAVVANVGLGVANSGGNLAIGNISQNAIPGEGTEPGAQLTQSALVGSDNSGTTDITAFGPIVAANSGEASNSSDGTADIRTGGAQGQGNVSTTSISQVENGSVDGTGLVLDTQTAGVLNAGVGVANSGLNLAVGNASTNEADLSDPGQQANIGSNNTVATDIDALGPVSANNSGTASNDSDGTAKVGTGGALASGNVSATTVSQHQTSKVSDLGLVIGTQVGGVANVGLGVANSGLNAAIGNASGTISPTGGNPQPNTATTSQDAEFDSGTGAPGTVTVVGPTIANNAGEATNESDGTACVCTGNAVASGNVSTTTLVQDLNSSVGTGAIVLTEAGGVLNAGVGLANSGLNLAIGNISQNTATATQTSTANAGLDPVVGPQVVHNGGGATNASGGTGKVGTGNASGTGNESTTNFVQAAAVDSDFAVATIAGGTTNTGLGLANSGLNLGIGNASVNDAVLDQTADGAGIVSNDGTAANQSDGSGLVGNPNCPTPGAPGAPGLPGVSTPGGGATLPHTGAPIEVEAAIGLMLLLAGFGLRRKGRSLA